MADPLGVVIHWFRRDLRIADNRALFSAASAAGTVVPAYILSDWSGGHLWTGSKRQAFLCGCLESLDRNLSTVGGRLILRTGDPVSELEKLILETKAEAIFYNRDPDPHGRAVEERLHAMTERLGVECQPFHDTTMHGPDAVLTQNGEPYRVYTPYSRNWLNLEKEKPLPKPSNLKTPVTISSLDLPTNKQWQIPEPDAQIIASGERAAHDRLREAVGQRLETYDENRDNPAVSGTSRISQDLRFGLLSPRTVFAAASKAMARTGGPTSGYEKFIKELAWREFYMAILWHYPNILNEEFNPDWRGLWWQEPNENFEAWKNGRTGFPIVDAGIRELLATGYMHNRVRMIVAMFLTKDLHIDWRLGEQFFMQHLIDGEIASNNGGWQWSAGTGADAAPYFRIQNPWTQAKRHDSEGIYTKRWVPELAEVPTRLLFEPPLDGKPIARNYPLPCVDHHTERNRTLEIFKKHRQSLGR